MLLAPAPRGTPKRVKPTTMLYRDSAKKWVCIEKRETPWVDWSIFRTFQKIELGGLHIYCIYIYNYIYIYDLC